MLITAVISSSALWGVTLYFHMVTHAEVNSACGRCWCHVMGCLRWASWALSCSRGSGSQRRSGIVPVLEVWVSTSSPMPGVCRLTVPHTDPFHLTTFNFSTHTVFLWLACNNFGHFSWGTGEGFSTLASYCVLCANCKYFPKIKSIFYKYDAQITCTNLPLSHNSSWSISSVGPGLGTTVLNVHCVHCVLFLKKNSTYKITIYR